MNRNIKIKKMHIKYVDKKENIILINFEKMGIAYNNNEAKKCYQEMNSIRKGFKPQTLLPRNTEGNAVNNKEMVKHRWSEYYEKQFELQDRTDNDSGEEWTTCIKTAE